MFDFSRLPLDGQLKPLDASDALFLEAFAELTNRHGKTERFGVSLLHRHFDLAPGEVLVERVDQESRTLTIRAEQTGTTSTPAHTTEWAAWDGTLVAIQRCLQKRSPRTAKAE